MSNYKVPGSFRDPNGYLFFDNGALCRHINYSYQDNYDLLISSGLYEDLSNSGELIKHTELSNSDKEAYKIIQPDFIELFSYPYEWSFSQLKDAALLTLDIQKKSIEKGMVLKDASSYNVTFHKGKAIFVDTLSFEKYQDGEPWVAYKQFCQHFLAPLALMSKTDIRLSTLLKNYIDGVPLDLASLLLPSSTYFYLGLFLHIHLHAKSQSKYSNSVSTKDAGSVHLSKAKLLAMIDSLRSTVKKLTWSPGNTEWDDYYTSNNNYNDLSMLDKENCINAMLSDINPRTVWDLGANFGNFSRIASMHSESVVAWDVDPSCVERNYLKTKEDGENITPLLIDLTNPSPSIGWNCEERNSFFDRGKVGAVLALGLVHHLAIANNVPLSSIFQSLSSLSENLIIEFVPKSDSQVKKLLSSREDIFGNYTQEGFERSLSGFFKVVSSKRIDHSERIIYRLQSI